MNSSAEVEFLEAFDDEWLEAAEIEWLETFEAEFLEELKNGGWARIHAGAAPIGTSRELEVRQAEEAEDIMAAIRSVARGERE